MIDLNHCQVCGTDFTKIGKGTACPVCDFARAEILGDPTEALGKMRNDIEAHRARFLKKCSVGMVSYKYSYDDAADKMKFDGESKLSFGRLSELYNKTVALNCRFCCPSERKAVEIKVSVSSPNGEQIHKVSIQNCFSEKAVTLGIKVDEDMNYQLLISGGDNRRISSESRSLF